MPSPEEPTESDAIVSRHRGLVLRTILVSCLTLLSRILGFIREVVMAFVFGDGSAVSDAFFTAWRVPNLFRRLFGEGALSTSLQTAITEVDGDQGNEAGKRLFLRTIGLTTLILFVVCAVTMFLVSVMPDRMPGTGWPWLGEDPGPVRDLTVRLMPFVVLVCITALSGGALFVRGHFAMPNAAPAIMNVVWIAALVFVGMRFGWEESAEGTAAEVFTTQWDMARLLAWGVLLGGVVQLVIHVPALFANGLLGSDGSAPAQQPAAGPGLTRGALSVLKTSAPLALGAAVYQINVMIDGLMAEGLLSDGGPTALYYANRIQQFPLALVAVATTNAVFPALKALGHRRRLGEMRKLHDDAQHGIVFLALPAAVGLWVLAEPIASVLFEHGNYGSEGTLRIRDALRFLALALLPAGAVGLAGRAFYALGDFRTPVQISIVMLVTNVGLNLLFVRGLGYDVEGLALATAITSWANLAVLLPLLRTKHDLPAGEGGTFGRLARVAVAAAVCGAVAFWVHGALPSSSGTAWRAGALAIAGAAGMGAYFVLAEVLGVRELDLVRGRFRGR